ncbi:hypothetical protein U9M48_043580 [Paspalum notatum var. saurae]|uniref:Chlorophyll synthase n=1 Tax=Paspalum notatum var. saurae TaxID=547442 RepID=A0AAQ3UTS5_PASNO
MAALAARPSICSVWPSAAARRRDHSGGASARRCSAAPARGLLHAQRPQGQCGGGAASGDAVRHPQRRTGTVTAARPQSSPARLSRRCARSVARRRSSTAPKARQRPPEGRPSMAAWWRRRCHPMRWRGASQGPSGGGSSRWWLGSARPTHVPLEGPAMGHSLCVYLPFLLNLSYSGNFHWTVEDVAKSIVCMIMSGPCLTGYTQTLNDWYDRDIDAINEPYRPIPSGAISENEVITQIWVLLLGGLGLGALLDVWAGHDFPIVFYLAVGGSLLSYIYSAPPLKLKQNGWIGNFALGASYISLPWWAGQALFGTLTPDIIVLTTLYSIAGLGIAIVNDFKSIEGDRTLGLQSLPVAFGMETAKWICVGYLLSTGKLYYALALLGLTIPQVVFQFQYFLKDPVKYDVKYQASAQPFFVLGLLVTALATSH